MDNQLISGIYAIQRKDSDECYIGSAVNIAARWGHHRRALSNGKHCSRHMQGVFNKHGAEAFEFAVLEPVSDKGQLLAREQVWLDRFKPAYNTATVAGSPLGYRHTTEARDKISAALKGRKLAPRAVEWCAAIAAAKMGHKHSAEARANMSAGKIGNTNSAGHVHSEVARAKISASLMGNTRTLGHALTPEHRAKLSAAHMGRPQTPEHIAARVAGKAAARASRANSG